MKCVCFVFYRTIFYFSKKLAVSLSNGAQQCAYNSTSFNKYFLASGVIFATWIDTARAVVIIMSNASGLSFVSTGPSCIIESHKKRAVIFPLSKNVTENWSLTFELIKVCVIEHFRDAFFDWHHQYMQCFAITGFQC